METTKVCELIWCDRSGSGGSPPVFVWLCSGLKKKKKTPTMSKWLNIASLQLKREGNKKGGRI